MEKQIGKFVFLTIVLFATLSASVMKVKSLSYLEYKELSVPEKVFYLNIAGPEKRLELLKELIIDTEAFSIPPNSQIKFFSNGEVYIADYEDTSCFKGIWTLSGTKFYIKNDLNVKLQEYFEVYTDNYWYDYSASVGPENTYSLKLKGQKYDAIWIVDNNIFSDGILKCMKEAGKK